VKHGGTDTDICHLGTKVSSQAMSGVTPLGYIGTKRSK